MHSPSNWSAFVEEMIADSQGHRSRFAFTFDNGFEVSGPVDEAMRGMVCDVQTGEPIAGDLPMLVVNNPEPNVAVQLVLPTGRFSGVISGFRYVWRADSEQQN